MVFQQSATPTARSSIPTAEKIREIVAREFGINLCQWQTDAVLQQLLGYHVIAINATGQGKTLPFFAPVLFQDNLILIIITPLNLLGKQQQDKLQSLNIAAIALNRHTSSEEVIKNLHNYRVIILSPELALNSSTMLVFWDKLRSMSIQVRLVIDEVHLMISWSTFRRLYDNLSSLKYLLPPRTTYYLTSATLPAADLNTILNNLALLRSHFKFIHRSNDRFNHCYIVQPITYTKNSKADLLFMFTDISPPPFIIYVQSKAESEIIYDQLVKYRPFLADKIAYVHADMEDGWRENLIEAFLKGELIGVVATDVVGLGMDLPHIELIIQYGAVGLTLNILTQRFGRGGRSLSCLAFCILFVEAEFTDQNRIERAKKRTAAQTNSERASKRVRHEAPLVADAETVNRPEDTANAMEVDELEAPFQALEITQPANSETVNGVEPSTIEIHLDNFINAGHVNRPMCRRAAMDALYENSKLPVPTPCCERCNPRAPIICCDICAPECFQWICDAIIAIRHEIVKGPRQSKQLSVDTYEKSAEEIKLAKSLLEWQTTLGLQVFGSNSYCGGDFLFGHDIIDRLVDLFHLGVTQREVLVKQCRWDLWEAYGDELMTILQPFIDRMSPVNLPRARATTTKCSVCKQSGHNKRTCPSAASGRSANKENSSASLAAPSICPPCNSSSAMQQILSPLGEQARAYNIGTD